MPSGTLDTLSILQKPEPGRLPPVSGEPLGSPAPEPQRTSTPLVPPSPWGWTIALALASVILVAARPYIGRAKETPFALTGTDRNGRMELRWDPASIRNAESAVVEVIDGPAQQQYSIDSTVLRTGALDYPRNTEDVTLTLTLMHAGQPIAHSAVRSISAIASAPAPPDVRSSHGTRYRTRQSRRLQ